MRLGLALQLQPIAQRIRERRRRSQPVRRLIQNFRVAEVSVTIGLEVLNAGEAKAKAICDGPTPGRTFVARTTQLLVAPAGQSADRQPRTGITHFQRTHTEHSLVEGATVIASVLVF
jgi:hypothetical protein